MKPFFSVVISVYNKAEYIKKTINSVLNQSFEHFELIVINDGSIDASEQIINTYKDKRLRLISTANHGVSKARNTGIKEALSNYIALLDGDDTWDIDYLQSMNDAIGRFPDIKIFTSAIAQKYENKIAPVIYSFKQNELYKIHNYFEASQKYSLLTSSSIVFDKSILSKTNFFDTSLISGEDVDMWIRFGLFYDIVFINKQLVLYNFNTSSLSNTTFDLDKKPKFDKYLNEEKENKYLKAFLDRNRYSLAILSKLRNDKKNFSYYTSHLNLNNIKLRQKLLLKSPKWILKLLLKLKSLKGEKLYYPNN